MSTTPSAHGHTRPTRAARATAVRTGHGHLRRASVGLIQNAAPSITTTPATTGGETRHSVHDYARRMAFLTELDSATWMARYNAADRLGDPEAVASVAGYAAWLRRTTAAWAAVPMPTSEQAAGVWPFSSLALTALDSLAQLEADVREMTLAGGGPRSHARATSRPAHDQPEITEDIDAAYVAGAAYVAVAVGQEVAVLSADVDHLSATQSRTPLPRHYVQHSLQIATVRNPLRRELADWADAAGPRAAERVVLTARMLLEHLASALVIGGRPGW
ncbi:MAG: hypothetical protein IPG94_20570 [Kineosporiaceae bacterium]|nr:hypothetical protein [Kineosporiaceae bacterium]